MPSISMESFLFVKNTNKKTDENILSVLKLAFGNACHYPANKGIDWRKDMKTRGESELIKT